jgi:tRNA pseudouridine38-40 synthase
LSRFACGIEYDGGAYCGWQRQLGSATVQGLVEAALTHVANEPVTIVGAGRTDAGVHALGQVAHFDTQVARTDRQWLLGANSALPDDVALTWVKPVPTHFHARYSALWRRYQYQIFCRPARSPLSRQQALWTHEVLAPADMTAAASYLLGEHDFSAFRAAACQANTPIRNLMAIKIAHGQVGLTIEVTANAFLHHMVRNIVGTLLVIGRGQRPPQWCGQLLSSRDRTQSGATAPAHGLRFDHVAYPAEYGLPQVLQAEAS